ncbi:MAG: hypothetical protein NTY38_00010 [Acidobacteria bacterium]|nr:hypothetical protein [Acidobacteriota bacterium]
MNKRTRQFIAAMGAYSVFSILALTTLDGKIRIAVLIAMAGLAVKTSLVWWREQQDDNDNRPRLSNMALRA